MSTNFVASTGVFLMLVVLLGMVCATNDSGSKRPFCNVTILDNRAFVICRFQIDVGLKKEKFHLMYKNEITETMEFFSEYELAFACFWLINGTLSCAGEAGYRLNGTDITDVAVIEVPREGAERKEYLCGLAGEPDPESAVPCCLPKTTPAGNGGGSGHEGNKALIIGLSLIGPIVLLAIFLLWKFGFVSCNCRRRRQANAENSTPDAELHVRNESLRDSNERLRDINEQNCQPLLEDNRQNNERIEEGNMESPA